MYRFIDSCIVCKFIVLYVEFGIIIVYDVYGIIVVCIVYEMIIVYDVVPLFKEQLLYTISLDIWWSMFYYLNDILVSFILSKGHVRELVLIVLVKLTL